MATGLINSLFGSGNRPGPRADCADRRLLAIAYFDMVGYSRLIGLDDVGTVERLRVLRRDLIEPRLTHFKGQLVQAAGDSLLVVFDSVLKAVRYAAEVQRGLASQNESQPPDHQILFRIGIDVGDIIVDGNDLHGDAVNVAARLQTVCPPGGICISRSVHEHVSSRLNMSFEFLGALTLKNIARPVEAFVVRMVPLEHMNQNAAPGTTGTTSIGPTSIGQAAETAVALAIPGRDVSWPRVYARPSSGPPWIAVLPFQQLGDQPTPGHICDGLVADIVCQLAGLRELSVISHGSTLGLRDTSIDPRTIGRQLGARYLVRGGIQRVDARTRLTTELTEAETGQVLWARATNIDDPLSFQVQDDVVTQVVNRLAPRVRDNELRRIRGKRPDELSVYEKVLLAREHILMLERDGFIDAMALLDDVIAEDPGYSEAYALAAELHVLLIGQGWSLDRTVDAGEIDRLARRALVLDADNVRALVCNGHRKSLLHRDYPTALQMFRRALDVSPHSAQVWQRSSFTFAYIGDATEAIHRAERALELSPCDREPYWFFSALCVAHYTAGNFDVAAEWGLRALGEQTMLRSTAGWAAASLAAAGRVQEAKLVATRTMEQWPERRVEHVVAQHPYRDEERRRGYGEHLVVAGFP